MLDYSIIALYLIVTLVVGIYQGRGISNLNTFAIADRRYSTGVLVATITATFLSGGAALGFPEKSFKYGVVFFLVSFGDVLYSLIQAKFIAPNIDKFSGCISVGDMMRRAYGKKAQISTGIAGTLMYITALGAQVSAMGYIFHYFLDMSHQNGVFIGFGIIIAYSVFGGIKGVTITDVIQFIVLMVAVPLVCNIGLYHIGGYGKLFNSLPSTHLKLLPDNSEALFENLETFLIFALTLVGPASAQRLLMAKDSKQATAASYYSSLIYVLFFGLVCCIGLSAKVLKPDLDPVLAMPYIIGLLPVGFKGIAISGLLAIVMSTADSILNTASILLVNDVIIPFNKRSMTDRAQLRLAQISTLLIGVFSIYAAFSLKSVQDIMKLSTFFWTPVIVVPFVAVTVGSNIERKSFWFGAAGAVATVIAWKLLNLEKVTNFSSTLPGMFGCAIMFFGSHYYYRYLNPTGYQPIVFEQKPDQGKKKRVSSNLGVNDFTTILFNLYKTVQKFSLVEASHNKVKEYGASYQLFGIFILLNYIWFTYTSHVIFLSSLKAIAGVLCVGLFFAPELTKKYNKYFSLYWYFTLMFSLPFISITMVILHNGAFYWLLNLAITTFFLAILVDWLSFIVITSVGLLFSCLLVKIYTGHLSFGPTEGEILLGTYMVISSIIIGAFFSRRREDFVEEKLATLQALGGSIAHELRTPLSALGMKGMGNAEITQKLQAGYNLAKEHNLPVETVREKDIRSIKSAHAELETITSESLLIIDMLLTKLKDPATQTEKAVYSIKQIVEEAIEKYPLYKDQKGLIELDLTADFNFYGNKTMLMHVIFNLLKNSLYYIRQMRKGNITITLEANSNNKENGESNDRNGSNNSNNIVVNRLRFRDTAKGIPAQMIAHIFDRFYSKTEHGTGLGLAFCKLVMKDISGDITCSSTYGHYAEFILEFPGNS